jgi:hypothetical protein
MAGASVSYVLPPALGVHQPVAPDYIIMNVGTTAVERVAMKDAYTSAKAMYTKARAFHNFIKVQIIKVVPELYIGLLADDSTLGYANVTPQALLTHLVSEYGKITPKELKANLARISAPRGGLVMLFDFLYT